MFQGLSSSGGSLSSFNVISSKTALRLLSEGWVLAVCSFV